MCVIKLEPKKNWSHQLITSECLTTFTLLNNYQVHGAKLEVINKYLFIIWLLCVFINFFFFFIYINYHYVLKI